MECYLTISSQLNLLSNILCDCIVNHFGLIQVIDSPMPSESILDLHAKYLTESPKVLRILISATVLVLQIPDCTSHTVLPGLYINYKRNMSITTVKSSFQIQKCKLGSPNLHKVNLLPSNSVFADNNIDNLGDMEMSFLQSCSEQCPFKGN